MRLKFYSWYIYHDSDNDAGKSISSAEYVEDVNSDSVVIVDGLTKVRINPSRFNDCKTVIHTELATSWLADLLGHWPQESHHCLVSIRYVVQCDSDIQSQIDQLRPQDLS